ARAVRQGAWSLTPGRGSRLPRATARAPGLPGTRGIRQEVRLLPLSPRVHHAGIVGKIAAHDRKHRADLLQIVVRYAEVVAVEHHQIPELAVLDRAEVVFFP